MEARKFKNQLEHSRTLLDAAFENEAKCRTEAEAIKRELVRVQVKNLSLRNRDLKLYNYIFLLSSVLPSLSLIFGNQ